MSETVSRVIRHEGDEERGRRMMAELQSYTIGPPTGPKRDEADLREQLRAAIAANRPAEEAAQRARDAVARAESYLRQCALDVADLVQVDQRAADSRTAALLAWAADGNIGAPVLEPPIDLAERDASVAAIEERRQATARALLDLRAQAAAAERKAVHGRYAVRDAAALVQAMRTERIAVEVHRAETAARDLRLQLVTQAGFQPAMPGVEPKELPISREARQLSERAPANSWAKTPSPPLLTELQAEFDELLRDPDASIE